MHNFKPINFAQMQVSGNKLKCKFDCVKVLVLKNRSDALLNCCEVGFYCRIRIIF